MAKKSSKKKKPVARKKTAKKKNFPQALPGEAKKKNGQNVRRVIVEKKLQKQAIEFGNKITLVKSGHTYTTALRRRYGRHLKKYVSPFKKVFKFIGIVAGLFIVFVVSLFLVFGRDLPDVRKLRDMNFAETTHIYDREGHELYRLFGKENREFVKLSDINPDAIHATISIEDKNFYHHFGFDPIGIIRAQLKNFQEDNISQGASTITQQLAKNIFLSPERTYDRKIKELLLSLEIEWFFSKDDILELYFNKIAYGSNTFGIEAAAQSFFGISAKDINLAQSSILAALPKAPSYYSPYGPNVKELMGYCQPPDESDTAVESSSTGNTMESTTETSGGTKDLQTPPLPKIQNNEVKKPSPTDNQESAAPNNDAVDSSIIMNETGGCSSPSDPRYVWGRKDYVLQRMVDDGYISKEQMVQAWKDAFHVKFMDIKYSIESPHFVFYVKDLLEQRYGKDLVENGGLQVTTTLDPNLQKIAENSIAGQVKLIQRYGANNAAMVALDPKTGQVLAMLGSRDYWDESIDGQVNVTLSPRQPGSSFKPLIYAAAIQNAGIGSGTYIGDYKTLFNKHDIPSDYDGKYQGNMTVRAALGGSRNIPAIKAYYIAGGEEKVLDFIDKLGVIGLRQFRDEFNKDAATHGWIFYYGWPMAIGSGEVKLLQLVGAYSVFANQGKFNPPNPILEVRDHNGNVLDSFRTGDVGQQVIDPQIAYIISNMLSDVYARPAGTWRWLLTITGHNVAAKTGTSNKKIHNVEVPNNNLTIGYTPSLIAGFWVGNTNGKNLYNSAYSLYTSDPIYHDFFTEALKDKPSEDFPKPDGLKWIGHEVFPSWGGQKDFEKMFVRLDNTQQLDIPLPDFLKIRPEDITAYEKTTQQLKDATIPW